MIYLSAKCCILSGRVSRFREGEARILVSTSVADEGLDVVKCNLVIKYNCATNEIAHVQRKGSYLFYCCAVIFSLFTLLYREFKLFLSDYFSLIELRSCESEGVEEELRVNIQSEATLSSQRIAAQKSLNVSYELLCSKCDALLCTSKDIKTYKNSQYCVCDPSFWSKTFKEKINDPDAQAKFGGIAKVSAIFTRSETKQRLKFRHLCDSLGSSHLNQRVSLFHTGLVPFSPHRWVGKPGAWRKLDRSRNDRYHYHCTNGSEYLT
ncbi:unnamed protein product [Angiostrongylus costaricensis]|uniref:RLR CTR domain-containing protein n=1 Tax=Angiostrongylus costaricensis TaxID=334426 RepID=A0A3P7JTW7_ANGCS|nr:unnamed protein product [Angiostrongylus costaricensis]